MKGEEDDDELFWSKGEGGVGGSNFRLAKLMIKRKEKEKDYIYKHNCSGWHLGRNKLQL